MKVAWTLSGLVPLLCATPLAQEARAVFDAATVQVEVDEVPFRRMLDFDGDGDWDAVGAAARDDGDYAFFMAYENDGRGVFTKSGVYYRTSSDPEHVLIEVGSLDADAFDDVLVVVDDLVWPLISEGDGTFRYGVSTTLASPATALALADIDLDGIDDRIWADDTELHVATSSGFTASLGFATRSPVDALRVLPGDGPASSDVFLLSANDQVRLMFGSSSSGLVSGPLFDHGMASAMLDCGDIDGDGDVDAVVFQDGPTPEYRVLRRQSAGSWTLDPVASGGPAEFLIDVDGDGDLDGVCCAGAPPSFSRAANRTPTEFMIAINDGTGSFDSAFAIAGVGSPQLAGAVDVDLDGDTDLVAGRCVYYARGPIRPIDDHSAVAPPFAGPRDVGDCDGDGDLDVGFSLSGAYLNDGNGDFQAVPSQSVAAPPGTRFRGPGFPGDFDGDGDLDLIVEWQTASRAQRASLGGNRSEVLGMMLLKNDGAGTLLDSSVASAAGVTFARGSMAAEASLAVDLDADGDLDLVARSMGNETSSQLWINDGTGFFEPGQVLLQDRIEIVLDVDLDGTLDAMSARAGFFPQPGLHRIEGIATGPGLPPFFAPDPTPIVSRFNPLATGVPSADLYLLDGYPDFAVVGRGAFGPPRPITVRNTLPYGSSAAFTPAFHQAELAPRSRVSAGDLDGDGIEDLLAGELEGELIPVSEILYGPGNQPALHQLVPKGLLLDLDGDGDLDILGDEIVFNQHVE